jgi:hypothetical protein
VFSERLNKIGLPILFWLCVQEANVHILNFPYS